MTQTPAESPIEAAVVRTVAYADVFDYPLTPPEVRRYLHAVTATPDAVAAALARCNGSGGALSERDGFWSLRGREGLIDLRRERKARSAYLWPAAVRYGHVIAGLPFVRMVAVTGSLAWDNVPYGGDIDYLVVTEPDRLWVCRWLLSALSRLVHLDGVHLCVNYMVSTRALLLAERNLYGAYEIVRMMPLVGLGTYRRLRRANRWADAYLPNAVEPPSPPPVNNGRRSHSLPRRVLARAVKLGENALRSSIGSALERWEMRYRMGKRTRHGIAQGEVSYGVDWYKEHTSGHRHRALAAYGDRLAALGGRAP